MTIRVFSSLSQRGTPVLYLSARSVCPTNVLSIVIMLRRTILGSFQASDCLARKTRSSTAEENEADDVQQVGPSQHRTDVLVV